MREIKSTSRAIASSVVAIIIVVIIVVAAVGAYYVMTSAPTTPTTSTTSTTSSSTSQSSITTSSQSSTQSSSSSSSSSQSTSSTTSTSSSTSTAGFPAVISHIQDFTGNFSQMKIAFSVSSPNETSSGDYQFRVIGKQVINGTELTAVNFTSTMTAPSSENTTAMIYFNSKGNITMVSFQGQNYTGTYASMFGAAFMIPFTIIFGFETNYIANASFYSLLQSQGTTSQTYGNLTMPVTTYVANNLSYMNVTISSITIKIGQVPSTSYSMLTYFSVTGFVAHGVSQGSVTFQLVSATRAS